MSLSLLSTTIFLCTCLFYGTCESYTSIEFVTLNDSIYVPFRTAVSAVASKTKVFFPALLSLTATNIVDVYDVVSQNWTNIVIQTLGTTKNFIGTEAAGKLYFTSEFGLSNEVDIYDVANDSFTQENLPSSKKQAVSVVHAPSIKCVFFAGGFDGLLFTDTIDIFHYDTKTWTGAKLSFPRFAISGAANDNYVIFAGGQYLQEIRADIDIYNTVTNQWSTAALSVARLYSAAVASQSDSRIYFAGGQTAFADLPATPPAYSSVIDVFNVDSTGAIKWSTMTLSSPRARVAGTSVGPYVFFAAGILNSAAGLYSNVVDVFNSTDNTFQQYTLPASYSGYLSGAATLSSTFLTPTRPRLNDSAIQVFNVHCADGNPSLACDDGNDRNGDGCSSTCEIERCWFCSRTYPSQCVRCCTDWEPLAFPGSGPRLCTSCQGGAAKLFLARVVTESPACDALNLSACSIQPCPALPCLNQSGTLDHLYYLSKPYLQVIFKSLEIDSPFTVSSHDNVLMDLRFEPCDNSVNVTYIGTIIDSILFDFYYGEGLQKIVDPANCRIVVQKNMTYWQYFSLLALLLPILIVIAILGFYYHSILHQLPEEINWSFMKRLTQPWRWTNGGGYYTREIKRGTDDWARVENLLIGDFESTNNIKPVAIKAVYNEHLIASFISFYRITQTRRKTSADVFFSKSYKNDEQKMWVMERFTHHTRKLLLWDYNEIPILPAIHGTDVLIAEKIAQTGFAALSSLDAGYFGRGIYFTTSILYTIPYCCGKRTPAIIIAYLNLGNIFPVTESHKGEKKLMGAALKSGYNSHFVVTTPEGFVYTPEDLDKGVKMCHEIVVPQESQILPAFIVELDKETIKNEFDNWIREIPTYVDELKQYNPALERSKEAKPDLPSSPSFMNSFGSQSTLQKKNTRSQIFEGGTDLGIMGQETQVLRILDGEEEVEYRQMI